MIPVVEARPEHVAEIAANLRADDRREVELLAMDPRHALHTCIVGSVERWVALEDGRPIAAWGLMCSSLIGGIGYPWMLTTTAVEHHKIQLVRDSGAWVKRLLTLYPRLEAVVDPRYTRALRWLRRMGFIVLPGDPFCTVYIEAPTWA